MSNGPIGPAAFLLPSERINALIGAIDAARAQVGPQNGECLFVLTLLAARLVRFAGPDAEDVTARVAEVIRTAATDPVALDALLDICCVRGVKLRNEALH